MHWLAPSAFFGLAAVAGPIVVHLLRRRSARRLIVPSVRFVVSADPSAVHPRRISDPWLLLVRIAIVIAAVLALARPLRLTDGRAARWADRISRVVVVDTSDSARTTMMPELVAAQLSGADPATTIEARELATGLRRAAAWLSGAPPSRLEVVVLSDFQRGALTERDLSDLPSEVGIRLVRSAPAPTPPDPVRLRVFSNDRSLSGAIDLGTWSTSTSYRREPATWSGFHVHADPHDTADVPALLRVLARAGVHAPASEYPIVMRFRGVGEPPASAPVLNAWTFGAGQRLLQATRTVDVPVHVTAADGSLRVDVGASPGSLAAAQVAAAALTARIDPASIAEHETAAIPRETLDAWSRGPSPPDPDAWRRTDASDARVFWGISLLLLGVESFLRGRKPKAPERADARAA